MLVGRIAEAGLVGIAGGVIAAVVAGWDPRQWRTYFNYGTDTLFNAMNGALANPLGVTNTTARVGWPHGLDMTDFPAGEPIFTWLQWFAGRFVQDEFTVLAAIWFLGFVLVAATTYLVLRGLKLGRWPSVVAALVYDFVPFHVERAIDHTNLALFMAVPLAGMVLLWVLSGRLDRPARSAPEWRPLWRTPDWLVVAGATFVIAVSARYYAVFFLILLVVVGVGRAAVHHRIGLVRAPAVILGLTLGLSLLTGLPQILQVVDSGRNSEVAHRSRTESDLYALRLTELVAPVPDHRVGAMADLSDTLRRSITRGEYGNSMGFFLLGRIRLRRSRHTAAPPTSAGAGPRARRSGRSRQEHRDLRWVDVPLRDGRWAERRDRLARLHADQGVEPVLHLHLVLRRSGSGAGAGMAVDDAIVCRASGGVGSRSSPAPLVLALALIDQTGTTRFDQTPVAAARASDRVFFGSMADELATGSSVFQMPYVPFPESGSAVLDYAGFRGFFNDRGALNWSFGGMRGRRVRLAADMGHHGPETQVVGLAAAGFDAILVDRAGYMPEDTIEPSLEELLGPAQGASPDGRFAWYDLRPLHGDLVAANGAEWVEQTGARVVRPIGIQFRAPTYRATGTGPQDYGSIGASTTVELRRYDDDTNPIDVELGISVAAGSEVTVSSGPWQSTKTSAGDPLEFRQQLPMTSEVTSIHITTNAPNIASTTESRSDVRGEIVELKVLDSNLTEQIARGELTIPTP